MGGGGHIGILGHSRKDPHSPYGGHLGPEGWGEQFDSNDVVDPSYNITTKLYFISEKRIFKHFNLSFCTFVLVFLQGNHIKSSSETYGKTWKATIFDNNNLNKRRENKSPRSREETHALHIFSYFTCELWKI